jgi:hypothetical protein
MLDGWPMESNLIGLLDELNTMECRMKSRGESTPTGGRRDEQGAE